MTEACRFFFGRVPNPPNRIVGVGRVGRGLVTDRYCLKILIISQIFFKFGVTKRGLWAIRCTEVHLV